MRLTVDDFRNLFFYKDTKWLEVSRQNDMAKIQFLIG